MPRFKLKGALERSASGDLWKHTLSRIQTVYGRLAYLASLRDPNSGIYRHHGLMALFGRDETARALRESHQSVFYEWLNLPLAEKHVQLISYLNGLEDSSSVVLDHWIQARPYKALLPEGVRRMESELFSQDLDALLDIVRSGLNEPASARGSLPQP
jgi:hypothetical protein